MIQAMLSGAGHIAGRHIGQQFQEGGFDALGGLVDSGRRMLFGPPQEELDQMTREAEERAIKHTKDMMRFQQSLQKEMDGSHIQRMVADAQKAGVNPGALFGGGVGSAGSVGIETNRDELQFARDVVAMNSGLLGQLLRTVGSVFRVSG